MAVSTSTFAAVIVGFLVVPLTDNGKSNYWLSENAHSFNFMGVAEGLYSHSSEVIFFLSIYFVALLFSAWSRKMALDCMIVLIKKAINKP